MRAWSPQSEVDETLAGTCAEVAGKTHVHWATRTTETPRGDTEMENISTALTETAASRANASLLGDAARSQPLICRDFPYSRWYPRSQCLSTDCGRFALLRDLSVADTRNSSQGILQFLKSLCSLLCSARDAMASSSA